MAPLCEPSGAFEFWSPDFINWLQKDVLPGYLPRARWFGAKSRQITGVSLCDILHADAFDSHPCRLVLAEVQFESGAFELYQMPLLAASAKAADELVSLYPQCLVARSGSDMVLDALYWAPFHGWLWREIFGGQDAGDADVPASRVLNVEQSNAALLFGDGTFVKLFRRIQAGPHPEAEVLEFLTRVARFPGVPAFRGIYQRDVTPGQPAARALAIGAVANQGDVWSWMLGRLVESLHSRDIATDPLLEQVARLGSQTGQLHIALCGPANSGFCAEPLTGADLTDLQARILQTWEAVLAGLPVDLAAEWKGKAEAIRDIAADLTGPDVGGAKIRIHGDLHLGQVLVTSGDFVFIDFEGEPARPIAERRRKDSPLRDVAGMLRSLHYVAYAALSRSPGKDEAARDAEQWAGVACALFLDAWLQATAGAVFRPKTGASLKRLLRGYTLEKVLYEIRYELDNRPDWLRIPLQGLARVLGE